MIADRRFTVERIVATAAPASLATDGRPVIMMSLEHPMQVESAGADHTGAEDQTVLIPAATGCCTISTANNAAPFLFVPPAQPRDQLVIRLRASSVPQSRIDAFTKQFS